MNKISENIIKIAALSAFALAGCSKEKLPDINTPIREGNNIYGVVTDQSGNRMAGVTVSDGFTCCVTDANGVYQLKGNEFSYHVFVSIPEDCKVPIKDGQPNFWKKLGADARYDFTLEKAEVETDFNLFCIADPQCQNNTHIARFSSETVPDIASEVKKSSLPCYGMVLGDVGYNTANNDYTMAVFPLIKNAMSADKNGGMPLFKIMGNHDNKVISVKKNDYTVAHDIAAQRNFEYTFGPINYSFNRGNVHIIGMDDMIFPNHNDYYLGFRDDQVEWLKQDLANVPKDKMIVLCVHVPLRKNTGNNVGAVLDLLKGYAGLHVMSGHTHYAENDEYADHYEHVHGAACGAWWWSTINTDGTPNGYAVYKVEGAKITDWTYKATGLDENYQIRLYRGSDKFYEKKNGSPYQSIYKSDKDIIANIWNADSKWKIEVYENGVLSGNMEPFDSSKDRIDPWASGYHVCIIGRSADNYVRKNNSHMFHYQLKDAGAQVKVVATDRFGHVYEQSHITTNLVEDYPAAN